MVVSWGPQDPHLVTAGPDWRRLALWATAGAVALVIGVANALLFLGLRPHAQVDPGASVPTAGQRSGGTAPTGAAPSAAATPRVVNKPLGGYVFPSTVRGYAFVSKGRIGDDEVGYYAGQGPLVIHKKSGTTLEGLIDGGQVVRHDGFTCFTSAANEPMCGVQLKDGVLLLVANDKETLDSTAALMTEAVKPL